MQPVPLSPAPPSFLGEHGDAVVRPPVRSRLRHLQRVLPVDSHRRRPWTHPVSVDPIWPRPPERRPRGTDARCMAHRRPRWSGHDGRRRGADIGRRFPNRGRLGTSPSRVVRPDAPRPPTLRVPHAVPRPARLPLGRGPAVGGFVPATRDRSALRFLRYPPTVPAPAVFSRTANTSGALACSKHQSKLPEIVWIAYASPFPMWDPGWNITSRTPRS